MPALLLRFLPYLLILVAVGGAWLVIDRKCWTSACHDQRTRADAAEARIAKAFELRDEMIHRWNAAFWKVEVRYVEVEKIRTVRFETIRERAGKIELAACPIPNDAAVLLRDITSAANAAAAPTVAGPGAEPEAPLSAPAGWVAYAAAAAEAYRERDDGRLECISRYNEIRDSIIQANEVKP